MSFDVIKGKCVKRSYNFTFRKRRNKKYQNFPIVLGWKLLCNTDFVCFDEMQDSLTTDDAQANIIKNINKNTLFPYHFR